jgi:c-di-GMP-binding flagellar brake protein YcgR
MNTPDAHSDAQSLTAPDRRLDPRYTVNVSVEIHPEGTDVPMRFETTDLSRGGCYIQMMMPFSIDTCVRITLWLDGCAVVIRGRVVTCHPQFGSGIKFTEFEDKAEQLLQRYLDAITT